MKKSIYAIFVILFSCSGCAIHYQSNRLPSNESGIADSLKRQSFPEIKKINDEVFLKNPRLKKQLERKGYKSYIVSVHNSTNDTIVIDTRNFYGIKDYQSIPYVKPAELLKILKFQKGLFLSISGYGLLTPFSYAGRKLSFGKQQLFIAVPLLTYGAYNTIRAFKSEKRLSNDINSYYILGKKVPPQQTISGFVVVQTTDDSFEFVLKKLQ